MARNVVDQKTKKDKNPIAGVSGWGSFFSATPRARTARRTRDGEEAVQERHEDGRKVVMSSKKRNGSRKEIKSPCRIHNSQNVIFFFFFFFSVWVCAGSLPPTGTKSKETKEKKMNPTVRHVLTYAAQTYLTRANLSAPFLLSVFADASSTSREARWIAAAADSPQKRRHCW